MIGHALGPLRTAPPAEGPVNFASSLLRRERRLALAGLAIVALMFPTAVAFLVDGRTLNGVSVWIKPLKFQASIGLYLLTLAWFFGALAPSVRTGRFASALVTTALAASAFEIAYIMLQAGRGLGSHYNVADLFHRTMYSLMGVGAVALTAVSPALAVLLLRHRPPSWPTGFWLAVVIGLALTFLLGAGTGAVLSPRDGHWVGGVRSDLGGIPVLGWSRTGGDLRVAHFLGMHALQILPLAGLAVTRLLPARGASLAVVLVALAYCALTALVLAQALKGAPLLPL